MGSLSESGRRWLRLVEVEATAAVLADPQQVADHPHRVLHELNAALLPQVEEVDRQLDDAVAELPRDEERLGVEGEVVERGPREDAAGGIATEAFEAGLGVGDAQLEEPVDHVDVGSADQVALIDVREVARMEREQGARVAARRDGDVGALLDGPDERLDA